MPMSFFLKRLANHFPYQNSAASLCLFELSVLELLTAAHPGRRPARASPSPSVDQPAGAVQGSVELRG